MTTWTISWNEGVLGTIDTDSADEARAHAWHLVGNALDSTGIRGKGPAPREVYEVIVQGDGRTIELDVEPRYAVLACHSTGPGTAFAPEPGRFDDRLELGARADVWVEAYASRDTFAQGAAPMASKIFKPQERASDAAAALLSIVDWQADGSLAFMHAVGYARILDAQGGTVLTDGDVEIEAEFDGYNA